MCKCPPAHASCDGLQVDAARGRLILPSLTCLRRRADSADVDPDRILTCCRRGARSGTSRRSAFAAQAHCNTNEKALIRNRVDVGSVLDCD